MRLLKTNKIICNAHMDNLYQIVCNSKRWPEIFDPCISVKTIKSANNFEHIEVTALVNEQKMTWESERVFLPEIHGINSFIIKPMKLVKFMKTMWRIISINKQQSLVLLEHEYEISEDIKGLVDEIETYNEASLYIERAIDENSRKELFNIKQIAEKTAQKKLENWDVNRSWSTSHTIVCDASQELAYQTIRNTEKWPEILDLCISAELIEKTLNSETIRIKARNNSEIISWDTQRIYYDKECIIDFCLIAPMPFLKKMYGKWRVISLEDNKCIVNVERNFEIFEVEKNTIEQELQQKFLINKFINQNAESELLLFKNFIEHKNTNFINFKSSYFVKNVFPETLYKEFVNIKTWNKIVPNCKDIKIIYNDLENQEFLMELVFPNGESEIVRSIRRCNSSDLVITYFQPKPPTILELHSGSWKFIATSDGTEVILEHSMKLNILECQKFFSSFDLLSNKQKVKNIVLSNSKATIEAIRDWIVEKKEI